MDIEIGELSTSMRAIDRNSALSGKSLEQISKFVLGAVHDDREHAKRVRAERHVSGGVSREQADDQD